MDVNRQIRNLVLIGFMATGKSTVGQLVAAQLGFRFVDTDQLIESRVGKTIREIFKVEGEMRFRAYESQLVQEMAQWSDTVVSTGGGLVAHGNNLAMLKLHSLVVCLWASPETIWKRASRHSSRPLLDDPYPLEKIKSLLDLRLPVYRQADVLVNSEFWPVRKVGFQVLNHFQNALNSSKNRPMPPRVP